MALKLYQPPQIDPWQEMGFAAWAKTERAKLGLKQAEMSKLWGYSRTYYSEVERGEKQPSEQMLEMARRWLDAEQQHHAADG